MRTTKRWEKPSVLFTFLLKHIVIVYHIFFFLFFNVIYYTLYIFTFLVWNGQTQNRKLGKVQPSGPLQNFKNSLGWRKFQISRIITMYNYLDLASQISKERKIATDIKKKWKLSILFTSLLKHIVIFFHRIFCLIHLYIYFELWPFSVLSWNM